MASNMIKHVNRAHSLNTTIAEREWFHQKHTNCAYTHTAIDTSANTQAPKPGHRQTQTDARIPETDRLRQTHTASVWPQHISLHYCQRCASVSLALLLMPSAWCTAILTACLSISLQPNPQPLNHSSPQPFLKMNHKTKYLSWGTGEGLLLLPLQSSAQHQVDRRQREGKKFQSGVDEWKKNQCRFTFPSPFHPPLPPPVRLSSVQLWLCDAKLMGAKLSSIHTLAYNALCLIPTHTNTRLLSLSLSLTEPRCLLSRRHPHAPAYLPPPRSLSLSLSLTPSWMFIPILSCSHRSHRSIFFFGTPLFLFLLPRHWFPYTPELIHMLWLFNKFQTTHPWPTCEEDKSRGKNPEGKCGIDRAESWGKSFDKSWAGKKVTPIQF